MGGKHRHLLKFDFRELIEWIIVKIRFLRYNVRENYKMNGRVDI